MTATETLLRAREGYWRFDWRELWYARDLTLLLVRRDLMTKYASTILGPLWFLIQPIVMALVFWLAINKGAGVTTRGVPPLLFNLAGLLPWLYFAQTFTTISGTFTSSSELFRKVYFPRAVIPLAVCISNLIAMAIQFAVFIAVLVYENAIGALTYPGWSMLMLPLLVLQLTALSLGAGLFMTALTVRFRDLMHALQFISTILMFTSLVFIPLANLPGELAILVWINPLAVVIENFRAALLGVGGGTVIMSIGSIAFTIALLIVGLALFQRAARTAVDFV